MGDLEVGCCLNNVNMCVNSDLISQKEGCRAGNVAQLVKSLPGMRKTLS